MSDWFQFIEQRSDRDCAICCIAMALGRPYEEVLAAGLESKAFNPEKGCLREYEVLEKLGLVMENRAGVETGDFVSRHRDWAISPDFFRSMAWGRKALLCVPSLNIDSGWHMVYSDGLRLWDPSRKKRYERFDQLQPNEIILFREGMRLPPAAVAEVRLAS